MAKAMPPRAKIAGLLDFDFCADVFELFLDRGRFVLVYALFDRLGSAVNQVLCLFEAPAGDFPGPFDPFALVRPPVGEHDGDLLLPLDWSRAARRTAARHHYRRRRG